MSIKRQAIRGAVWISIATATRQVIFFALSIVLYRLLVPADFGIITMASVVITALALFQSMGIGAALIHRKDEIDRAASTAFYIFPVIGAAMALAGWLLAGPVARFYHDPLLRDVIRVMALAFFPSTLGRVFLVLLEKELLYFRKMWAEIGSYIAFGLVALSMAFMGYGVWSLVWGYVAQEVVYAILGFMLSDFRPSLVFDRKIALELINYGKHVLGFSVISFFINQGDRALVKKMFGDVLLGYYGEAFKWGRQPVFMGALVLGRVTFSAYAKIHENLEQLRDAFLRTFFFLSQLAFPFCVGIFCLAPELVALVFGEKWDPQLMVPLLRVVCVAGLILGIQVPTGSLFQAVGKPHYLLRVGLFRLVLIIVAIYPMTRVWGVIGTAWTITGSLILVQPAIFILTARILRISTWSILLHLRAAVLSSAVMGLFLVGMRWVWPEGGIGRLMVLALSGGGLYTIVLYTVSRAAWMQLTDIFGAVFKGGK